MSLEIDGFSILKKYLNNEKFIHLQSDILNYIKNIDKDKITPNPKNNFNSLRREKSTIINKRCKGRDGDEGLLDIWHIDKSLNIESNKILNKLNNDIINLLNKSFNTNYKFVNNNVYVNKSITETRGIHADSNNYPSRVKFFLYLTDINDIYDGPFSFIKGSHKKIGLKYHRKYNIFEPLNEDDKKNYIIFEPKQNDLLIACVSGAHRGMPQKEGRERIVLVGSFDPI